MSKMGDNTDTSSPSRGTAANRRADQAARRLAELCLSGKIAEDVARREILAIIWRTDVPVSIAKQTTASLPNGVESSLFEEVRDHAENTIILKALGRHQDGTPHTGKSVLDLNLLAEGASVCGWARELGVRCVKRSARRKAEKFSRNDLVSPLPEVDGPNVRESEMSRFSLRCDNVDEQATDPQLVKVALSQNETRKAHKRENLRTVARSVKFAYEVPNPGPVFAEDSARFVSGVERSVADRKVHRSVRAVDTDFVRSVINLAETAPSELVDSVMNDLREPSPPPSQTIRDSVARTVRLDFGISLREAHDLVNKLCLALATADRVNGSTRPSTKQDMTARRRAFEKTAVSVFPDQDPFRVAQIVYGIVQRAEYSLTEDQIRKNLQSGNFRGV